MPKARLLMRAFCILGDFRKPILGPHYRFANGLLVAVI